MENSIVLEVGVSDGFDTERIYKNYRLPIYGFEPVPYLHSLLNEKFKNNKNIHIQQAAVDIEDGEKDFYISNPKGKFQDGSNRTVHPYGCSSLYNFSDDIHEKWPGRPDFNAVEKIKVKTIRLETFLDENNFDGEIVFMHCDAQGNDVNVLMSLGKYLKKLQSGKIEVAGITELYKDTNNTVNNAKKFLLQNGFMIVNGNINNPKSHEVDISFKRVL